jgi:hypothetical protein
LTVGRAAVAVDVVTVVALLARLDEAVAADRGCYSCGCIGRVQAKKADDAKEGLSDTTRALHELLHPPRLRCQPAPGGPRHRANL